MTSAEFIPQQDKAGLLLRLSTIYVTAFAAFYDFSFDRGILLVAGLSVLN
jgi:hypothetical protein